MDTVPKTNGLANVQYLAPFKYGTFFFHFFRYFRLHSWGIFGGVNHEYIVLASSKSSKSKVWEMGVTCFSKPESPKNVDLHLSNEKNPVKFVSSLP